MLRHVLQDSLILCVFYDIVHLLHCCSLSSFWFLHIIGVLLGTLKYAAVCGCLVLLGYSAGEDQVPP